MRWNVGTILLLRTRIYTTCYQNKKTFLLEIQEKKGNPYQWRMDATLTIFINNGHHTSLYNLKKNISLTATTISVTRLML